MVDLIYKDEVYAIVGAAMEVHKVLGCGFLEPVYQEALEVELAEHKIPYEAQKELRVYYKEHPLQKSYVADIIAFDKITIEIKALTHLAGIEESQLLNYPKATGLEVGLLINFGAESLEWKRMVKSRKTLAKLA